jgi:hypothetical protein
MTIPILKQTRFFVNLCSCFAKLNVSLKKACFLKVTLAYALYNLLLSGISHVRVCWERRVDWVVAQFLQSEPAKNGKRNEEKLI